MNKPPSLRPGVHSYLKHQPWYEYTISFLTPEAVERVLSNNTTHLLPSTESETR